MFPDLFCTLIGDTHYRDRIQEGMEKSDQIRGGYQEKKLANHESDNRHSYIGLVFRSRSLIHNNQI